VLVSIDTLRADRLPAYGYADGATPAVDRLAREGMLFEHAFTPVPLTLPAHATLLTGLLPPEHGVRDNLGYRLNGGASVVPRLKAAGYRTAAAVSSVVLRRETGLANGFDLYDDAVPGGPDRTAAEAQRPGPETLAAVESWLRDVGMEPFFLFLHLYEPHAPYEPPPGFDGGAPYDGEIAAADAVVGRLFELLDRQGLYDRAAILLLSDHGEGLGDHGEDEHGILLHHEVLHVPLIVKLPGGGDAGRRVVAPAHLADVAPTLLELAGLPSPEGAAGASLLAPAPADRPLYAETYHPYLRYGWSELLSLVAWPYHLIEGPTPELYDLAEDPGEQADLASRSPEIRTRLLAHLRPLRGALAEPFEESEEVRQRLAALGYLDFAGGEATGPRPGPKERLPSLRLLRGALDDLREGRAAQAEAALRSLVAEDPRSLEAWQFLGEAYRQQRRWEEAYHAFSEALALGRGAPPILEALGHCALELGRPEEAVDLLELAMRGDPESLPVRFALTDLLLRLERPREAAAVAEETVERTARRNPDALFQLALVELAQGRGEEAERALRRAVEVAPDHAAALYQLALVLAARASYAEAEALLERVLDLTPDDANARRSLEELRRLR
jgi:arylsulfatase A-like enzyme/Tfp pilus assembly protein PilF